MVSCRWRSIGGDFPRTYVCSQTRKWRPGPPSRLFPRPPPPSRARHAELTAFAACGPGLRQAPAVLALLASHCAGPLGQAAAALVEMGAFVDELKAQGTRALGGVEAAAADAAAAFAELGRAAGGDECVWLREAQYGAAVGAAQVTLLGLEPGWGLALVTWVIGISRR
jgi:hypothetical protein